MELTHGSLFSGIGGFDFGFEKAGFRTAWQVEIDRFCSQVLERRFPSVRRFGDIRSCHAGVPDQRAPKGDWNELAPVSVITFGSPCQDLSIAGRRKGIGGSRSSLFFEAIRIIREMRKATSDAYPRFSVWENVPGAFSSNGGRDFHSVLQAMADCGAVEAAWRTLDARWFGVGQRRRRVFVVSDFGGESASKVLFESEGVRGHSEKMRKAETEVARCIAFGSASMRFDPSQETYVCSALKSFQRGVPSAEEVAGGQVVVRREAAHPIGVRTIDGLPRWLDGHSCPNSPRYRALGNAICVSVSYWIANRIKMALEYE